MNGLKIQNKQKKNQNQSGICRLQETHFTSKHKQTESEGMENETKTELVQLYSYQIKQTLSQKLQKESQSPEFNSQHPPKKL